MLTYCASLSDSVDSSSKRRKSRLADRNPIGAARVHRHPPFGFTLIEVLIALIVLSVGLLSLAALQIRSLGTSHNAYLTSVASIQALGLAEVIRANPDGADVYRQKNLDQLDPSSLPTQCDGNACSATALAQYDLQRWAYDTRQQFPGGLHINLMTKTDPASICPTGRAATGLDDSDYELELCWNTPSRGFGQNPTDDDEARRRRFTYVFRVARS